MSMRGIGAQLLDLLFPPRCQVCGCFSADPLCQTCEANVQFIDSPRCLYCGRPLREDAELECRPGGLCEDCRQGCRWLSAARSCGLHTDALREAILAYKFHGRRNLAPIFAEMLAETVGRECDQARDSRLPLHLCEALLPVPLHPMRRRWRGFDQAELLCHHLAERLGMPTWTDALERVRDTAPQTELSGRSRRTNVRRAFRALRACDLRGRSFILVDDVLTTGATLDECALTLKRAGAGAVYGLTVSRAMPYWYFDALARDDEERTGGTSDA
jgi:ComF family protein